jgi:hypothetical protein
MIGSSLKRAVGANPFVGPRPFETGRRIFGRDREIDDLYYLLSAERIVLLHSPSGAGKSSLIQAGLIPRLNERFDVWGPTRVNLQPPAGQPAAVNRYVRSAVLGFEQQIPSERRRSEEQLSGMTLSEYVATRPRRRSASQNTVLIFDQFEEILTADPLAIEAKHEFFRQLGDLLLDPRIWALFALREDYLAPFDQYAQQVPTHMKNRFRLDLLSRDAAKDAIVSPSLEGGRECAPEAVEKLIQDLATMKVQQPDGTFVEQLGHHVEPLQLQVVCLRLWERMPEDDLRIDLEDVTELGDVTQALSGYYAGEVETIAGGDDRIERAIREWVGAKLITPDGIRGQVLRGAGQSEGLENELIASLVNTHLVRGEQRAGAVWYELAHDRLIEPVRGNNRDWFDAHLHKVQKVATLWEAQGRPDGLLLLGEELIEAKQWAAQDESSLTAVERKFLEASTARQEAIEKDQRQAQRMHRLLVAMGIIALLAVGAAVVAGTMYRTANRAMESEKEANKKTVIAQGETAIAQQETARQLQAAKEAEAEAVAAKEATVKELAIISWKAGRYLGDRDKLDETSAYGVRSLYNTFKNIMGLDKLQSFAPVPIFKQGPHKSDFNYQSNQFGHYNSEFVQWAAENLIPAAKDPVLRQLTQPVYDKYMQEMARLYYLAYANLHKNPNLLSEVVRKYQNEIEKPSGQVYDLWGKGPGPYLHYTFHAYSTEINDRRYKWTKYGYPGLYADVASGFWVRRQIDGTSEEFRRLLQKLMETYDADWLRSPEAK